MADASEFEPGLNSRLIEHWNLAALDLGIRVTAPVKLRDASGKVFACEAFVEDFGSARGAVIVSPKTERRVRQNLRSLAGKVWCSSTAKRQSATYVRKHFIEDLRDWGWFGRPGDEPSWYHSD